jgi:dipeptidyl-peptidase 4
VVDAELEHADASRLFATGWTPPVRECVTAADGKTDLYAVYFAPQGRFAGAKNPVIDAAYGGPQVTVTPRNFIEAYCGGERGKSSLAHLGFAIVTVDARGTPMRNRYFVTQDSRPAAFVTRSPACRRMHSFSVA